MVLVKSSCSAFWLEDLIWLLMGLVFDHQTELPTRLLKYKISLHELCMNLMTLLCKLDHVTDMHREPARVARMVQCVEPAAEFVAWLYIIIDQNLNWGTVCDRWFHIWYDSRGPITLLQYYTYAFCLSMYSDTSETWWAYLVRLMWCSISVDCARPEVRTSADAALYGKRG